MKMPDIQYPPSRPQSVGEILDLGFRIFGTTLLKCLPYSFLAVILGQLPTFYDLASGRASLPSAQGLQRLLDPLWWLVLVVAVVGSLTLSNAVMLRQHARASGHSPAARDELARGLRRVPGMLLIVVLLALAVLVTFIPLFVLAWQILHVGPSAQALGFLWLIVAGYVLLLVSASWAIVRWICSGAIYLLTERAAVASMRHSWHLTSGSFWRLTLIYSVGIVLLLVLYALASVIAGAAALVIARGDVAVITAVWAACMALLGVIATPFYSALVLAVYGDLAARKEGTDLAQRMSAPAAQ